MEISADSSCLRVPNPDIIRKAEKRSVTHMLETLKKLLEEELQIDPATITEDAELSADLGINSIELANLIMICEEKFDITIDDDDIHKLVTVGDVVAYLESLQ
jgi:acyl carrier protein